MTSRFMLSSQDEIKIKEELGESSNDVNANTKKSTQTWFNVYKAWATWRGKKTNLEEYVPSELNEVLSTFYCEVRKSDGRDYEPDCLRVMQSSLYRYLSEKKYPKSIVSDTEFKSSQDVLEGKIRRLRIEGKGKKTNTVKVLTHEVEERLWHTNKLGHHSPVTLIHTMWFNNTKYFGLRGRENHVALTMDNFKRKMDENGVRYIELSELPTTMGQHVLHYNSRVMNAKMIATGGIRCPVALFEFYISKRPNDIRNTGRFYLSPRHNISEGEGEWFRQCPMGKNTLSRMLKNILDPDAVSRPVINPTQEKTDDLFPRLAPRGNVNGPLIERLHVGEDSEYAIIKIPRPNNSNQVKTNSQSNSNLQFNSNSQFNSNFNFNSHLQANHNSSSVDGSDSDDGSQVPTMSDLFTTTSPHVPTMTNVFTVASQLPSDTSASTNTCTLSKSPTQPTSHFNNHTSSPTGRRQEDEQNDNRKRENVFTHVDEKGSINVFYNCNVTFVQSSEARKSRKRKLYPDSSPEQ